MRVQWNLGPARASHRYGEPMSGSTDFEQLVSEYYRPLYQFACSLTHTEADASDLTQQTFYIWAAKGHQLRDVTKIKTWLFTTLHREFLNSRRRFVRFPHQVLEETTAELPVIEPPTGARIDADRVLHALAGMDELHRAPVALFYLNDYTYKEIAEALEVPLGTVKSRLARGIAHLQRLLSTDEGHDLVPPADGKGGA